VPRANRLAITIPPDTVLFAVGPEAHLAAYERELRAARGEATLVLRLYPRDFWDTGEPGR
jgi:hypothetical protein